jgi:hypothetical protein
MNAGIPGAGIGGLFYLANALLLPLRGLWRRLRGELVAWRPLFEQWLMGAGVLFGIWLTGWLLGLWLGPAPFHGSLGARPMSGATRTARILGAGTLLISLATLVAVLLSVQLARVRVKRRR